MDVVRDHQFLELHTLGVEPASEVDRLPEADIAVIVAVDEEDR